MPRGWKAILVVGVVALTPTPALSETLRLAGGEVLDVHYDAKARAASIALLDRGAVRDSMHVDNALEPDSGGFEPDSPLFVKFCAGCPLSYVVNVPDATANYDAETGIVVWRRGQSHAWRLTMMPFPEWNIVTDARGVSLIENTAIKVRYRFVNGKLVRAGT